MSNVKDWRRDLSVETPGRGIEPWPGHSGEILRGTAAQMGRDAAKLFPSPHFLFDRKKSGPEKSTGVVTLTFKASATIWRVTYTPVIDYKRSPRGTKIPLADIPTR